MILGIDGGGTRTRAALVGDDGTVLGVAEAGPSNPQSAGGATARESIRIAAEAAASMAETRLPATAAFLATAGVLSERDRDSMRRLAAELSLAPDQLTFVDHDLRAALAGGLPGEPGIVLIAGTGSSCYGRTADGRSWRAGGWGPLLDDLGSAWWLAVEALTAITRAADGRGPATALTERLQTALGITDLEELLQMTGTANVDRARIAALAPFVLEIEEAGDEVAGMIVQRGIEELARMVHTVADHLGWFSQPVAIVVSGGLGRRRSYRRRLELTILQRTPAARIVDAQFPPVLGAALLALENMGTPATEVAERMRASCTSLPPALLDEGEP